MCTWPQITWYTCGGQRISFVESGFLPPLLIRVPGIELSSPGIFIHWAILPTLSTIRAWFFFFLFPLNNIYRVFSWSSGVTQCARNAQIKSLEMEEPERADGAIRSQLQKDWQGSWRDGDRPLKKQKNCASCHHKQMQTRKGTCQKFKCYKMYTCGNIVMTPPHTNM